MEGPSFSFCRNGVPVKSNPPSLFTYLIILAGPLTEDYMDIVERGSKKALVKQRREAPAVFKHRGMYYMVTSGCTSWAPNGALVHVAESMLGQWVTLGDPCVGGEEDFGSITFFSQGTFVLPLPGLENTFIFMADRLVVDPHVWWMKLYYMFIAFASAVLVCTPTSQLALSTIHR